MRPPVSCGRQAIFAASSAFRPRPTTWAVTPPAFSSSATAQTLSWQLSASSCTRIRLRLAGAAPSDLAASRTARAIGPLPRGLSFSSGSMMRCTSSGSGARSTSTSVQSPRRWLKDARPTRVCGPTLASPRRTASRPSTSLLPFAPSMPPHIEPEPSNTMTTAAGSAACTAVAPTAAASTIDAKARQRPRLKAPMAVHPSHAEIQLFRLYSRSTWFSEDFGFFSEQSGWAWARRRWSCC